MNSILKKKGVLIGGIAVMCTIIAIVILKGVFKSNASSDNALSVKIVQTSSWQQGSDYYYLYSVDVKNTSGSNVTEWSTSINFPSNVTVVNSWCGDLSTSNSVITVKPVEFNKTINANSNTSFGFICSASSKISVNDIKINYTANGKESAIQSTAQSIVTTAPATKETETKTTTSTTKCAVATTKATTASTTKAATASISSNTAATVSSETGTPVANHGKLSLKGTNIVDCNGKVYTLKGVSTHGIQWFGQYVNKDAFKTMRDDWGINVVRLAMYTDPNAGYTESMQDVVDKGVQYATELGLYVIIDWHILSDGNPNTYKSNAITYFNKVSAKYKNYDNVLYEICNEPNGDVNWSRDIKPYAKDVISTIRKNDTDGLIIVGSSTWSQDVDVVAKDPITGYDNIMYSLHFYAGTHKDDLRNKMVSAINSGLAIFVSEFGICDASGNGALDYDSANAWINVMNKYNVSFAIWNLSNKGESSALINSSVSKTSGWTKNDLSDEGKWFVEMMGK